MKTVLVGMFDTQSAAQQARQQLIAAGFAASAVSLTAGDTPSMTSATSATSSTTTDGHEQPGPIARFFDNLFGDDDASSRDSDSETYREAFRRGAHGVSVQAETEDESERAESILNSEGAIDIDTRSQSWRQEGWSGGASSGAAATLQDGSTRTLQEVEEELKVGKRAVARGGVRIYSRVLEVPVQESVTLREEHANVQRRTVDRPATEADFASFKEGSIEVREMAEEAVVSKTARVVGEVEIGKSATEREEVVRDTVRRTQVDVEPIGELAGASASGASMAYAEGGRSTGTTGMSAPTSTAGGSANRDPLTGEPGAHPVGTGVGALAGGVAAGAAAGSVVGPVGTAIGAAAGAVVGGLAGKGVAEKVDPTAPASAGSATTPKNTTLRS